MEEAIAGFLVSADERGWGACLTKVADEKLATSKVSIAEWGRYHLDIRT